MTDLGDAEAGQEWTRGILTALYSDDAHALRRLLRPVRLDGSARCVRPRGAPGSSLRARLDTRLQELPASATGHPAVDVRSGDAGCLDDMAWVPLYLGARAMYHVDAAASALPDGSDGGEVGDGVVSGPREHVEKLLRGAEVGDTLLHLAAKFGAPRIVRALLALGAPARPYNSSGRTPRECVAAPHGMDVSVAAVGKGQYQGVGGDAAPPLGSAAVAAALEAAAAGGWAACRATCAP